MSQEERVVRDCLGQEIQGDMAEWSAAQLRRIQEHPCYSPDAAHHFGRMHLPVAPKCNVQCNFCQREFDCVNESRPGVTSQVLKPLEAVEKVGEVIEKYPFIKVIGVAGPGDPLFNEETFATLALVRERFPDLYLCLSTNGLLLPQRVKELADLGVGNLTVTVNAVDPEISSQIYSFIYHEGEILRGPRAANVLLDNQVAGIAEAVRRGMIVKVNSVYVPGVNEDHLVEIAKRARDLGVYMQNIIPVIPQYKFAHIAPPTAQQRRKVQAECGKIIRQMRHCRQCRADAVGLLSQDLSRNVYKAMGGCAFSEVAAEVSREEVPQGFRVAVATTGASNMVDMHFGHAREFQIYQANPATGEISFVGTRSLDARFCQGEECDTPVGQQELLVNILNLLRDCRYVVTRRIGYVPANWLREAGIEPVQGFGYIDDAIRKIMQAHGNEKAGSRND